MGVIRRTYNFVMGLIGLVVIGAIVFLFLAVKWHEYKEEKYAEERDEIANAVAQDARERGLGDLDQLREEYLAQCPIDKFTVLEGGAPEICSAMADALLDRSRQREMTLTDHVELGYQLCALQAKQDGDDPDEWCDRQETTDDTLNNALTLALCTFDRAWFIDPYYESSVSKRGNAVYVDQELRIDCETRLIDDYLDYEYEGFFARVPYEDEELEWTPTIADQIYAALDLGDHERVNELLDGHPFGDDEQMDQWILNLFMEDRFTHLLPEVLDRNGGKVNFDTDYYDQPLSVAIEAENPAAVMILLDAGADPLRPSSYGSSLVVRAASNGMLDIVKELVARGADVNGVFGSESLDYAEALMWAAYHGHEKTALWLLENGAGIEPEDPSQYPMWSPNTMLDLAVIGGSQAVVQAIFDMGARSEDPLRLIQGAVEGGNPDVLLLVFEQSYEMPEVKHHDRLYDAVVDVIKEEGKGRIEHGVTMFELLLDRGLDMSEVHESGWHYGHQAVIHYAPPTVQREDSGERDALVRAKRLQFVKRVIDEVLAAGINIDLPYESETVLMEAADGGQPELVRHLLERGADATLTNDEGQTALDIAVSEGRRLINFWDENEALRNRFAETIEILGGSREMLDPAEEPGSAT